MLGPRQEAQGALFYEFSIEDHVPQDHLLRSIDRFVDLSGIRQHLVPFYSNTGRPSIDPELLIRMPRIRALHWTGPQRKTASQTPTPPWAKRSNASRIADCGARDNFSQIAALK